MINFSDREERVNTVRTFLIGGTFIMCLWVFFPWLIHRFIDPVVGGCLLRPSRLWGGVVSGLGYALAVWCVMLFIKEGRGTPLPFSPPKKLVVKGPYRFVRNPMVLGTVLFLLGDALLLGSCAVLLYVLLVFLVMHFFILAEEKSLTRRFGAAYTDYLKATPRWVPRLSKQP